MTIQELTNVATTFRDQRDWKQFHTPKELAIQLMVETAELAELMLWRNGTDLQQYLSQRREDLSDELGDILHGLVLLADEAGIDLQQAFMKKMEKNALKYPVEKSRGSAKKYNEL